MATLAAGLEQRMDDARIEPPPEHPDEVEGGAAAVFPRDAHVRRGERPNLRDLWR